MTVVDSTVQMVQSWRSTGAGYSIMQTNNSFNTTKTYRKNRHGLRVNVFWSSLAGSHGASAVKTDSHIPDKSIPASWMGLVQSPILPQHTREPHELHTRGIECKVIENVGREPSSCRPNPQCHNLCCLSHSQSREHVSNVRVVLTGKHAWLLPGWTSYRQG